MVFSEPWPQSAIFTVIFSALVTLLLVALAPLLAVRANEVLFDQPLSNLDAKLRVRMRVEIKRPRRSIGVTSIYVTHDQIETG